MSKIRALNEADSDDSENEDEPKQSREAQEAQATNMYNSALQMVADGKYEEALEMLLNTIGLQYLNESDSRKLSPEQNQLRLSCLKGLATLFRSEQWGTQDWEAAVNVYLKITELEPTLLNNWVRLGDCASSNGDLVLALDAFKQALSIRSGHYLCLDKAITLSYALHDLYSCLHFCAMGFHKDKRFAKSIIFRDNLFKNHPWTKCIVESNPQLYSILLSPETHGVPYDDLIKDEALKEARDLLKVSRKNHLEKQKLSKLTEEEVLTCPDKLNKPTFTELCQLLLTLLPIVKKSGTLLRPVSFKNVLSDCNTVAFADGCSQGSENSEVTVIKPPLVRSRSSSDDKDQKDDMQSAGDSDTHSQPYATPEWDEKSEGSKLTESEEDRKFLKKKPKRDLKWWQMEGKRRSPRVRGNLVSVLPHKPKIENTFTETLKNIIPTCLLRDSNRAVEGHKTTSTFTAQESGTFFNTNEEFETVKGLVTSEEICTVPGIVYKVVVLLSRNSHGTWPKELIPLFLQLESFFSSCFPEQRLEDEYFCSGIPLISEKKMNQLYAHLTRFESLSGSRNSFFNTEDYIELQTSYIEDKLFVLRRTWLEINRKLREDEKSVLPVDLEWIKSCLIEISPTLVCHTASQANNIISLRTIKEKSDFLRRVEYSSDINSLYESKNFKQLVEVFDDIQSSSQEDKFDIQHRLYLAKAYQELLDIRSVIQYVKIIDYCLKNRKEETIIDCIDALQRAWCIWREELLPEQTSCVVNILVRLLTEGEKGKLQASKLLLQPWLFLHEILYYLEQKEPEFYIEEETVPNSVLLLQLAHEFLSQSSNCCMENGQLLTYSVNHLISLRNKEDYWTYEETKTCLEQSVFCLYGHPSKNKTKLKNIKDHGSPGIELDWLMSLKLVEYYKLDPLPEFDSNNKGISSEIKTLFDRILANLPDETKRVVDSCYKHMQSYIDGTEVSKPSLQSCIPSEVSDMFYLIGDYFFRDSKEFSAAKKYYIKDLSINPTRSDSWAALSLIKVIDFSFPINSCIPMPVDEIISKSAVVAKCFDETLLLDTRNTKLRVEYGTFLYSVHSLFSRELKYPHEQLSMEKFEDIEKRKEEFLSAALKQFDIAPNPPSTGPPANDEDEAEVWINHYMLGKVMEKKFPLKPRCYLDHYEMAANLLKEQGASYPSRINYNNPPDLSIEAIEIHYRIHASILSYIERLGLDSLTPVDENILFYLMDVIDRARNGPFGSSKFKCTDTSDTIRKKGKTLDDKKDESVIQGLLDEIVSKVEEGHIIDSSSESQDVCSVSSDDSSLVGAGTNKCLDSQQSSPQVMTSFSLSAFKEKMQSEKEEAEAAEEARAKKVGEIEEKKSSWYHDACKSFESAKKFLHLPYGIPVVFCLAAMIECISRFPQCFKAYYRLAYTHKSFIRDMIHARRYYLGPGSKRIPGLFGDRKANNFFYNIWRNPVDDIDRVGSFPFHMAKTVQLLTEICQELSDFQTLADLGLHLQKIPDSQNVYLYPQDRELYAKEAITQCVKSAKKVVESCRADKIADEGQRIYDAYLKFQKANTKQNVLAPVMLKVYKKYITVKFPHLINNAAMDVQSAIKFFQHRSWAPRGSGDCQEAIAITMLPSGFNSESQKRITDNNGELYNQTDSAQPSCANRPPPLGSSPQAGPSPVTSVMPVDKRFPSLAKNAIAKKSTAGPLSARSQKVQQFSNNISKSADTNGTVPKLSSPTMGSNDLMNSSSGIVTSQRKGSKANEKQVHSQEGLGKSFVMKKIKKPKLSLSQLAKPPVVLSSLISDSNIRPSSGNAGVIKHHMAKPLTARGYQSPAGKLTITPISRGLAGSKSSVMESRSYMSSSPFRSQSPLAIRSMSPPSILGLPIGGLNCSPPKSLNTPPAAHSQGMKITNADKTPEIEVVDLSVSPEKTSDQIITSRTATKPFEASRPLRAPLPSPRIVDIRSLAPKRPANQAIYERGSPISLPPKKKFHMRPANSPSPLISSSPSLSQEVHPRSQGQSSSDKDVDEMDPLDLTGHINPKQD